MNNRLKKDHAMETLSAGTLTRNLTLANNSVMVDAKAPRITLLRNKPANINARIHRFKRVNFSVFECFLVIDFCILLIEFCLVLPFFFYTFTTLYYGEMNSKHFITLIYCDYLLILLVV